MLPPKPAVASLDEAELIARAQRGDEASIRIIIARHNSRMFRLARGMIRDDSEAEDVLQEAYFKAFRSIGTFRGDSSLATWLRRIVVNEALQRLRRHVEPTVHAPPAGGVQADNVVPFPFSSNPSLDPERAVAQQQIGRLIERAIDMLPDDFRVVFVARVLDEMSVEETAELVGIRPETVKTRLFRARRLLREALAEHIDPAMSDVFPFAGRRCERLAEEVVQRLKENS